MTPQFSKEGISAIVWAFFAVCLSCTWLSCERGSNWSTANVEESKRRGAQIIEALEKIKRNEGVYPKSLEELVPKYLASLPQPAVATAKWTYIGAASDDDFLLKFSGPTDRDPVYWYHSKAGFWEWDTK